MNLFELKHTWRVKTCIKRNPSHVGIFAFLCRYLLVYIISCGSKRQHLNMYIRDFSLGKEYVPVFLSALINIFFKYCVALGGPITSV